MAEFQPSSTQELLIVENNPFMQSFIAVGALTDLRLPEYDSKMVSISRSLLPSLILPFLCSLVM